MKCQGSRFLTVGAAAALAAGMFGLQGPTVHAKSAPDKSRQTAGAQSQADRYWVNAKREVDRSVLELLAQNQDELGRGLRYSKFIRGDRDKKQIALTFDDGPHPAYTPRLLAILKQYNVKATFFLVGEMAEKHPELVKDELAAGMAIGNHTYHHVNLTKIPPGDVATEIKACGQVLSGITGKKVFLFRPPGGDYDRSVAEVSEVLGYKMILWTDDPGDYASPGSRIIEGRLLDRVSNGGVILIHDGIQQTIDVLPQVLQYLKGKGYEFVTVPELMASARSSRFDKVICQAPKPRLFDASIHGKGK